MNTQGKYGSTPVSTWVKNDVETGIIKWVKEEDSLNDESNGVCSFTIFGGKGGQVYRDHHAPCHGSVGRNLREGVCYIVTSLCTEKNSATLKVTKELNDLWYTSLFNSVNFGVIRENTCVIEDGYGKVSWAVIRITEQVRPLLGTFLILSRHISEEVLSDRPPVNGSFYTTNFWYQMSVLGGIPFDVMLPFSSHASVNSGDVYILDYPHGHSAIDGIPTCFPLKGKDGKYGFSREKFNFFSKDEVTRALESVLGRDRTKEDKVTTGLLKNPVLYYAILGKNQNGGFNHSSGYKERTIRIGTLEETRKIIPLLFNALYGEKK